MAGSIVSTIICLETKQCRVCIASRVTVDDTSKINSTHCSDILSIVTQYFYVPVTVMTKQICFCGILLRYSVKCRLIN